MSVSNEWNDLKEEGMQRSHAGNSQKWRRDAVLSLLFTVRAHEEFTAHTVWLHMNVMIRKEGNMQGMGAVMKRAAEKGWCEMTDQYRNEKLRRNHGRPQRIWKSLRFNEVER